ncbi:MAG: radical SAM protein [Alphaproteobacteria bacterium]|nr:radical SAM protein [Alphaproteobacteria bacterium]
MRLSMAWLDTLWLQVTGTVCNIACRHCFISCGPKVRKHDYMTVEQCQAALDSAKSEGLRAIWFTGGEPFLHPDILELMDAALEVGPLGVLTNGMLIDDALAAAIGERFRNAPYNLEIRVSLDGCTAEQNDRIRGKGVFDAACAGLRRLAENGVPALVAVSLVDDDAMDQARLVEVLTGLGLERPRIKWIPAFRIGREERRGRGYEAWEMLTPEDVAHPETPHRLQCGTSRTVTSNGVWPCPILINEPDFRLADSLDAALGPHRVDHKACYTCYVEGFSCST